MSKDVRSALGAGSHNTEEVPMSEQIPVAQRVNRGDYVTVELAPNCAWTTGWVERVNAKTVRVRLIGDVYQNGTTHERYSHHKVWPHSERLVHVSPACPVYRRGGLSHV